MSIFPHFLFSAVHYKSLAFSFFCFELLPLVLVLAFSVFISTSTSSFLLFPSLLIGGDLLFFSELFPSGDCLNDDEKNDCALDEGESNNETG